MDGCRCDYTICGDKDPYLKGHPEYRDEAGMVHLYSQEVQERCVTLGLTTHAKIKRNVLIFKAVCVPGYYENMR